MKILLIDLIVRGFEGALDHAIDDTLVPLCIRGIEDFGDTDRRALDTHELSSVTQELCFLNDRLGLSRLSRLSFLLDQPLPWVLEIAPDFFPVFLHCMLEILDIFFC